MKTAKQIIIISLITYAILFLMIGFIAWDFNWMERIPDLTSVTRLVIIGVLIMKTVIDIWILKHLKDSYLDIDLLKHSKETAAEVANLKEMFNVDQHPNKEDE